VQAGKELLSAAKKGKLAEVRRLLDAGAEVETRDAVSVCMPPLCVCVCVCVRARARACVSLCVYAAINMRAMR
jgi:hypothetical protein